MSRNQYWPKLGRKLYLKSLKKESCRSAEERHTIVSCEHQKAWTSGDIGNDGKFMGSPWQSFSIANHSSLRHDERLLSRSVWLRVKYMLRTTNPFLISCAFRADLRSWRSSNVASVHSRSTQLSSSLKSWGSRGDQTRCRSGKNARNRSPRTSLSECWQNQRVRRSAHQRSGFIVGSFRDSAGPLAGCHGAKTGLCLSPRRLWFQTWKKLEQRKYFTKP